MTGLLQKLSARLRGGKVRDPRPRATYYDGSEKPDSVPPARYARGKRATPALPPTGM